MKSFAKVRLNLTTKMSKILPESQNVEYKTIWKDEYLEWICGFANAQGGSIFVGENDGGNVVGVSNAKNYWKFCQTR